MGDRLEAVAIGVSVVALGVAGVGAFQSHSANNVAQQALDGQQYAERTQVASRVFLGEAPPQYEGSGFPIYAVTNVAPTDVYKVWVDGNLPDGTRAVVVIDGVQRCFLYTLNMQPHDFEPRSLHAYDGIAYWTRSRSGELAPDKAPTIPSDVRHVGHPRIHPTAGSC